MLRRSSLVECVSVIHGTYLQSVEFVFIRQYMCSHVCQKILSTHFIPQRARQYLPLTFEVDRICLWRNNILRTIVYYIRMYIYIIVYYITNLVCYTYIHWFFSPESQHIFGKQTGYIFQSPNTINTWTTKHYAPLSQWYNTE